MSRGKMRRVALSDHPAVFLRRVPEIPRGWTIQCGERVQRFNAREDMDGLEIAWGALGLLNMDTAGHWEVAETADGFVAVHRMKLGGAR